MPDGQVQIFISYAHNDNVGRALSHDPNRRNHEPARRDSRSKGFVDFLHEQLVLEMLEQGYPGAKIWRDPRIGPADPFAPMIRDEIAASAIFVAIMSRNWLASSYCQDELRLFLERWRTEEPTALQRRLVVVSKHDVNPEQWPQPLQGQRSIRFFSLDQANEIAPETEFYSRGEVRDDRYWQELKMLARTLGQRTEEFGGTARPAGPRPRSRTLLSEPPTNGRVIFLAKPANDMRRAYDTLVKELSGRGYAIVPDPATDLPYDSLSDAVEIIERGLAAAEVSVHLIGDSMGFRHDGSHDPIVKLQLRRAAAKVQPFEDRQDTRRGFHRIVWAPRVIDDAADAPQTEPRDPCAVLAQFDTQLPGDCLEGDTLGSFVDFLSQHLVREAPARQTLESIEALSRIYVYHPPEDMEYAFSVAKALRQRNVEALLPAFDDTPSAQVQLHRQYLRDCDSVVLCWASGSETWAKVNSHALLDWQTLGRTRTFARRGLVAGPPPGMRKRMFVELYPKNEIDVVVDLTGRTEPTPEDLNPLFDGSAGSS